MVKRAAIALCVSVATALTVILLAIPARAGTQDTEHPVVKLHGTILASTGLNVATPVIIGLCLLAVGLAFVAWAFLRGSSARRRSADRVHHTRQH